MRISPAGQSQDFELYPAPRTGDPPRGRQSFAFCAAGGIGSVSLETNGSHRTIWANEIPGDHGHALFADARPSQFLLVFARTQTGVNGFRGGRTGNLAVAGRQ